MKFKSFLASILLVSACAFATKAEPSYFFDNPDNSAHLGVRFGLDFTSAANGDAMYSSKVGFSLGAVYNIPLAMNFYFEPGVGVFYNPFGKTLVEYYNTGTTNAEGQDILLPYQVDGSIRNFGFRIPLRVGYHFDFSPDLSIHVLTGPQIDLSLMARYHRNAVQLPPDGDTLKAEGQSIFGTGGFHHVDLSWYIGVGMTYGKYYIDLGGSLGMTHMLSKSTITSGPYTVRFPSDIRRNIFTITLGYNF